MLRKFAYLLVAAGFTGSLAGSALAWFSLQEGQVRAKANLTDNLTGAVLVPEGGTRGRIVFPAQGQSYFLVEGATKKNLLLGPAHVTNSALPGGMGNSIIAAHRDTQFRILKQVQKGQRITIEERGHTFEYVVTQLQVVEPGDENFYQPTSQAVLTLVTCYPFTYIGPAPKRFVVRATLIDPAS